MFDEQGNSFYFKLPIPSNEGQRKTKVFIIHINITVSVFSNANPWAKSVLQTHHGTNLEISDCAFSTTGAETDDHRRERRPTG